MLKSETVKMFKSREDKITMMKKFEARRWKKSDKFGLLEDDLMNYIINGMDNSILQTQAKMKEFKELSHMLQVMGDITNDEGRASTNRTAVVPPTTNTSTRPRSEVRCFNCNQEGHISNKCLRPKRDRGSCFECGSMGHQKRNCPQRRGENMTTPDSTILLVEENAVIPPFHIRKCIRNFACKTKPLYDLLKKDVKFQLSEIHFNAFDELKTILASNSVLSVYSPSADTEVYCAGYGAILMQRQDQDKEFHPVMFFRNRTTEAESKYHSYELEYLAVVKA
ncbi:hypothetical protein Trydic_g1978 [Trypoxylus dichotomus]